MKNITELQKASLLSLLIIVGFFIEYVSSGNIFGYILMFIGGYNLGKVIRLMENR